MRVLYPYGYPPFPNRSAFNVLEPYLPALPAERFPPPVPLPQTQIEPPPPRVLIDFYAPPTPAQRATLANIGAELNEHVDANFYQINNNKVSINHLRDLPFVNFATSIHDKATERGWRTGRAENPTTDQVRNVEGWNKMFPPRRNALLPVGPHQSNFETNRPMEWTV